MILRTVFLCLFSLPVSAPAEVRWAVYYDDKAPSSAFRSFDLIILDSDCHPPLAALTKGGKTVLGYLSLGEVEDYRSHFQKVKAAGLLLEENPHWKGSHFVDVRDPRWSAMVLDQLVPAVLGQGFHGLFLDTLDNAVELERRDPSRNRGMRDAAARLVSEIRRRYARVRIAVNRAYDLLPQIEHEIDIVVGESVFASYDQGSRQYRRVSDTDYREQVRLLQEAKSRAPNLLVFTLDYWKPEERSIIRSIYRTQRKNGFEPYVATIRLDRIMEEPR